MSVQEVALQKVNEILSDPKYHDILAILKGFRNGLVYGVKVSLPALYPSRRDVKDANDIAQSGNLEMHQAAPLTRSLA